MARYGVGLAWQHNRRVLSVFILLRPEGVPREVPEVGVHAIGETSGRVNRPTENGSARARSSRRYAMWGWRTEAVTVPRKLRL